MKIFVNVPAQVLPKMPPCFSRGRWPLFGPGSEETWYATLASQPEGLWDKVAEEMMLLFAKSGLPVLRGTSLLSRGPLESKGGGKTSTQNNVEPTTAESLLRIIVSVSQLSLNGAIVDRCQELAQRLEARAPQSTGTLVAKVDNEEASQVPSKDLSSLTKAPLWSRRARGNFCAATRREIRKLSRRSSIKESLRRRWFCEECLSRTILYHRSRCSFGREMVQQAHVHNLRILEVTKDLNRKDLFEATPKLVQYWES